MFFLWAVLGFGVVGGSITVIVSFLSPVRIDGVVYRGIIGFFVFCGVGAFVMFVLKVNKVFDVWMGEKGVKLDVLESSDSVDMLKDVMQKEVVEDEGKLEEEEKAPTEKMVLEYAEKHPEEVAKVLEQMSESG